MPHFASLATQLTTASQSSQSDINTIAAHTVSKKNECLPVSVITTCYGRNRHLYNLLASLAASSKRPAEVIIVNDDADINKLNEFELNIVQIATSHEATSQKTASQKKASNDDAGAGNAKSKNQTEATQKLKTGFDIGLNRNKGAKQASFETLLFLDVDCIVSYHYIEALTAKLEHNPTALLMGQPRYLKRPLTSQEAAALTTLSDSEDWLKALSLLNPYRHNLVSEEDAEPSKYNAIEQTQDYGAFWSLCFAIKRDQFERIGGFDSRYIGYGSEDTDFAFTARQLNIAFYLTDDVVYHQQHAVYRPPLNHLSSIVVNANLFFNKWQHWPMSGWLAEFADQGLIAWREEQVEAIEVLRLPNDTELEAAYHPDAPFV